MELRQLIEDEDAVSPVIGVILMVAITVILAAVIGTFVLGLGDQVQNTAPSASFTFDFNEGTTGNACDASGSSPLEGSGGTAGALDITHDGGPAINENRLAIGDDGGNEIDSLEECDTINTDGVDVTAGTTVSPDVDSVDVIRVTWSSSGGDKTATLGKWTGPDA